MDILPLLPKSHIITHLNGNDPHTIISTLAKPLLDDGIITDLENFVAIVLDRESKMTTQLIDGIAVPHGHSPSVRQLGLTIGIADDDGIAFAPNTPGKCKIFFCIAVPSEAPGSHLSLLGHIADVISDDNLRTQLLAASTPEAILDAMNVPLT